MVSVTIDDAFEDSGDENVTQKQGCFLGLHKTADRVSLDGY